MRIVRATSGCNSCGCGCGGNYYITIGGCGCAEPASTCESCGSTWNNTCNCGSTWNTCGCNG